MKICKYPPETLFKLKYAPLPSSLRMDYHLITDSYFDLALGYADKGKIVKKIYAPLPIFPHQKDCFAIMEIIEKQPDLFLVRLRKNRQISGYHLNSKDLAAFFQKHQAYYTTFSLEAKHLFFPFADFIQTPLSLLHYFYEAYPVTTQIRSMAILADPAGDLKNAYQEGVALYNFLKALCPSLSLTLITHPLDAPSFDRVLKEHTIVHFSGHMEDRGLFLGKEFYHPSRSLGVLPSLLFLNTCRLSEAMLEHFLVRKPRSVVFSTVKLQDSLQEIEKIQYFYLGLLLGYRIGDVALKCLDFSRYRLYGWLTNRLYF